MNDQDRLRLLKLLNDLEEDTLSSADRDEILSRLKASDSAQRLYLEYTGLSASLREYAHEQIVAWDDEAVDFEALALMESTAATGLVVLDPQTTEEEKTDKRDQSVSLPTARELMSVAGYLLGRAAVSKPGIIGLAAAVLAITASIFVLTRPASIVQPDIATNPPVDTSVIQREPRVVVATLTATHQAQWSAPGPTTGDKLKANQRLTLTHGFAEITTQRGAIFILEAPATIEFTDHNNTISLHTGKLVGICETESSKGFVVHTPNARVVDLGTEFGIEVSDNGSTHAAVFVGEIELSELGASLDQPARNIRLTAGWASQVNQKGELNRDPRPVRAHDHGRYAGSIQEAADPGFAYRRTVLMSKPVVYWGFDEQQRATLNLAGNHELNGHAIGQFDHAPGLFGSAVRLTGKVENMGGFISDTPLSLDTDGYTLEAWCKINQPHHGRVMTLAIPNEDPDVNALHHSLIEVIAGQDIPPSLQAYNPSVRFMYRNLSAADSAAKQSVFASKSTPLQRWVHLVATYHGNQVRIYIDGELVSETDVEQAVVPQEQLELFVGAAPTILKPALAATNLDFRCFNGLIDEVAVYDAALTQDTIQQHYRLGRPHDGGQSLP